MSPLVEYGHQPLLELHVVVVGHQQVPDPGQESVGGDRDFKTKVQRLQKTERHQERERPVDPLLPELLAREVEGPQVGGGQALGRPGEQVMRGSGVQVIR